MPRSLLINGKYIIWFKTNNFNCYNLWNIINFCRLVQRAIQTRFVAFIVVCVCDLDCLRLTFGIFIFYRRTCGYSGCEPNQRYSRMYCNSNSTGCSIWISELLSNVPSVETMRRMLQRNSAKKYCHQDESYRTHCNALLILINT